MLITTLCYIIHNDHCLLLHRTKKENDINEGKWIGVGGKFADRESPEDCLAREVAEETGYHLENWRFRGFITFLQQDYETEYMCLYTASVKESAGFEGDDGSKWPVPECDEGELAWVPIERIGRLNLWDGDRIFLRLLLNKNQPFFSLKLRYEGDKLLETVLDGESRDLPSI